MWPIKTKAEIHQAYMFEIEKLTDDVLQMNNEIERIERRKKAKLERIGQLAVTAKIFE